MDYYIYKHVFANGTIYIGKGTKYRWKNYTNRNKHWLRLKRKYGNPISGIMFFNLTEERALKVEIKLIRHYKRHGIKMCNMTSGGEGTSGIVRSKKQKKLLSTLAKRQWENPEFRKRMSGGNNPSASKVEKVDPITNTVLEVYDSIKEAALITGIRASAISSVCSSKTRQRLAGSYFWRYYGTDEKYTGPNNIRPVLQLDAKSGNILNTFDSATDAGKKLNLDSSSIIKVCKNKRKTAGGFKWRYQNSKK